MDNFKISMASVAILALAGCGESNTLSNRTQNNDSNTNVETITRDTILIDDVLNPSSDNEGISTDRETDITRTTVSTETSDADEIFQTKNVGYTLNSSSLPVCYNTEDTRLDYSDTKTYTCKWLCGIYEGDGPIQVTLTFTKVDTWELTEEKLSNTSSRCH